MKVALITRSTLYSVPGGDTVQATQTSRHLNLLGVDAEVKLANEPIDYTQYDLLHFFNIIRPADILYHSERAAKPYVVSTILVDYSEYDKHHRKGIGALFSLLPSDTIEYFKTIARWLLRRDHLSSVSYLWKGQRHAIFQILKYAKIVLPNSESEYSRLSKTYPAKVNYHVVPNGIDPQLFTYDCQIKKDDKLVLCVARIEGIKNQLNLIKGLNNSGFKVLLVGAYSSNQLAYCNECKQAAASNITFINHLPQHELVKYYAKAKVHILPSWFETTGLSSVEAAVMGCNVVITDRGDAREYFGSDAFYCDPASPKSILSAVKQASLAPFNEQLKTRILKKYTWSRAAGETLKAYQSAIAA
jgi:glycosyltransferase involved in cell wall biosynthesis